MASTNKLLTKEEILHLAKLANLSLTDEEIGTYQRQLSDILSYIKKLEEVDTSATKATSYTVGLTNIMRPDELSDNRILKENKKYFKVKRIM